MFPGGGNKFGGQNDPNMDGRFGGAGGGLPQQPDDFVVGMGEEEELAAKPHPLEEDASHTLEKGLGFFGLLKDTVAKQPPLEPPAAP